MDPRRIVMVVLLALDWLRQRRIPPLHALSAVLVVIFGSATLLLHNRVRILMHLFKNHRMTRAVRIQKENILLLRRNLAASVKNLLR